MALAAKLLYFFNVCYTRVAPTVASDLAIQQTLEEQQHVCSHPPVMDLLLVTGNSYNSSNSPICSGREISYFSLARKFNSILNFTQSG